MKTFVASCTAALVCFLVALGRIAFAVPNDEFCDGPFNGCSPGTCIVNSGKCTNGETPYVAYDLSINVYSYACNLSSESNCNPDGNIAFYCDYVY